MLMAERLIETRTKGMPRASQSPAEVPGVAATGSHEAIRDAISCLEQAGRCLRAGETVQADEALSLLRAAAAHLESAVDARARL